MLGFKQWELLKTPNPRVYRDVRDFFVSVIEFLVFVRGVASLFGGLPRFLMPRTHLSRRASPSV